MRLLGVRAKTELTAAKTSITPRRSIGARFNLPAPDAKFGLAFSGIFTFDFRTISRRRTATNGGCRKNFDLKKAANKRIRSGKII
jgi:hypothetical protein